MVREIYLANQAGISTKGLGQVQIARAEAAANSPGACDVILAVVQREAMGTLVMGNHALAARLEPSGAWTGRVPVHEYERLVRTEPPATEERKPRLQRSQRL